jgi:glutamine amidotransferase
MEMTLHGKIRRQTMIAIIDYGLGNIRAFANVYKGLNMPCRIASIPSDFEGATHLILPGVGAFDEAMQALQKSGMRETLEELVVHRKIPVLGICVGMQMLAHSSEEGRLPGLGWVSGEVRKFDLVGLKHKTRLPHMGWNIVTPGHSGGLFRDIESGGRFYFLHSYYFQCGDIDNQLAESDYNGKFVCAVHAGNIYGVQFHPEKSHHNGTQLLKNFGDIGAC